tara:strand:+ start:895 stop:1194 length:300 start_codon:yes stop_codon:yes gene_type:complete
MDEFCEERPIQDSYTREEIIEILTKLSDKIDLQNSFSIEAGRPDSIDWAFIGTGVIIALGELTGRAVAQAMFDDQHKRAMAHAVTDQESTQESNKEVKH